MNNIHKNDSDILLRKKISEQEILIQNLRGELAGNTCIMCNYLERAACYQQKNDKDDLIQLLINALSSAAETSEDGDKFRTIIEYVKGKS